MQAGIRDTIAQQIGHTLARTDFDWLGRKYEGKVRDNYSAGDRRFIIVTDRLSAFDRVIAPIPFKGQVLNEMAAFWFERTGSIVKNHMLAMPDPNAMVVRECQPLPIEVVVRAYLTGVTSTSIWTQYQQGARVFCGHKLADGMVKNQPLPEPIVTPSTKAEKGGHDESVSAEEIVRRGLLSPELMEQVSEVSLALFRFGSELLAKHNLILVDTKYEFGLCNGELVLIDEIHTPDSSRFWIRDTYEERFARGEEPEKIDKEYLREWLASQGFRGDGEIPEIPTEVIVETAYRYLSAAERIMGRELDLQVGDVASRLEANLRRFLSEGR
ncbi:MAG TPA: phosphoribosylaminoimidazolesuccinocarboxamide synthase [Armatimonadota bacterium]|nr:phosphoribosylaminoimidazolesuccinocarboxamide synthase [Armatimonadota bacterium]HOM81591.1 phosphoribosylaminoimidazolesuccinocarboxamide synthase [Armatimonadota bacterium]HOQ27295.1 phosphoribosylaminoimidazolesuccinocarboxamide synthase [Armatimonadota bacterium]HPO71188.1 phosphoribosylaminoimidazolesuccinocarboxamide synthase [Armatimonadota bacterium]HPT97671.1 phosphoribosylaminoimidazolesuccinocarboxamide synthase [Armatimonadota bacterium]